MNNIISNLFFGLANRELPSMQSTKLVEFTQAESFFHLAIEKKARVARLIEYFTGRDVKKVYLSANLAGFDCQVPGFKVDFLEKDFFLESDPARREWKKICLEGAIVIVNNNDIGFPAGMPLFADFYNHCDRTIFIAWDWDNHHWLDLSTFLAAHSDLYVPAHYENLYLLSRYNWLICGPVHCATVQWSRKFLTDYLSEMLHAERSSEPLGKHIPYILFSFRLKVIKTLNQFYPAIGFSDRNFHIRSPESRIKEWCSYKTHWIVPVLNDFPIRICDAMVTGGIPIVPESLRFLSPINAICPDYIAFYSPSDIVNPEKLVARANAIFDKGGSEQLIKRHRHALDCHHGETRVHQMLSYATEAFQLKLPHRLDIG
jgi:hypothetical protein